MPLGRIEGKLKTLWMIIHTFNKNKAISAYIQAIWILIHVRESMWDGMEGIGMGKIYFHSCAKNQHTVHPSNLKHSLK